MSCFIVLLDILFCSKYRIKVGFTALDALLLV